MSTQPVASAARSGARLRRLMWRVAPVVVIVALVAVIVSRGRTVPDGPLPVAWDRAPCAHCHMQIGEPRHAVQLITTEGRVHDFDDVGCAIAFLRAHAPAVHRLWFHGDGDSWIGADAVTFVSAPMTPMGSGLMAIDRRSADGSAPSTSLDELLRGRAEVLPHEPRAGGPP